MDIGESTEHRISEKSGISYSLSYLYSLRKVISYILTKISQEVS